MKILIIGGTGAMGEPLTEYLSQDSKNTIYVMSRSARQSAFDNVKYLQGDAYDNGFFFRTLSKGYDVIVDFMAWYPMELEKRLDIIFSCCKQYIAMSSSAVYADADGCLCEDSPRLIDSYSEEEAVQTHRYHIRKSVADNIIMNSPCRHWTLARPSLTFNKGKITLLGYSKEIWLWRYLHGLTVVIPQDVLDKKTTITYGGDAARAIAKLVGNKKALGQVINVASDRTVTQGEIIKIYQEILPKICGKEFKVKYISDSATLWNDIPQQYDIYKKDRLLDRCFSTKKLTEVCGEELEFGDLRENLELCLRQMLEYSDDKLEPTKGNFNGWMDRMTNEHMPLSVYSDEKEKFKYVIFRNSALSWLYRTFGLKRDRKYRYVYKES